MEEGREKGVISPAASSPAGARGGSRDQPLRPASLSCGWQEAGGEGKPGVGRRRRGISTIPPGAGRRVCGAGQGCCHPGHCSALPAPHRAAAALQHRGQREEEEERGCFSTADSGRAPPLGGLPFQRNGEGSAPRRAPQGRPRRGGGRAAAPCGSAPPPPPPGLPSPARPRHGAREAPSPVGKRR